MSFESYRTKGRVATLLILALPIVWIFVFSFLRYLLQLSPSSTFSYGIFLPIIGYAVYFLFLVAMNGFAKYYNDSRIFKNVLYVFILSIIFAIILLIVSNLFVYPLFDQSTAYATNPSSVPPLSVLYSVLQILVPFWLGVSLVAIVNAFLFRRAFYALSEKSGEEKFRQGGFFIFIGGLLTIVFVGALLVLAGWALAVLGFFSMKPIGSEAPSVMQGSK